MNQPVKLATAALFGAALAGTLGALSEPSGGGVDPSACTRKIADLEIDLDQRFDQIDQKLTAQAGAIANVGSRVDASDNAIRSQLASMQTEVAALSRP